MTLNEIHEKRLILDSLLREAEAKAREQRNRARRIHDAQLQTARELKGTTFEVTALQQALHELNEEEQRLVLKSA